LFGVQNVYMSLLVSYIFSHSGNWDTLEVRPKAKGLDTRHELTKFYEEYYSANIMHLVIYGKGF
jgi:secreted Zn-dependent insulinase-like peptidase